MILNYPSGFYKSVLPPAPDSMGNITYTISGNEPPRGSLFFLKMTPRLSGVSSSLESSEMTNNQMSTAVKAFRPNKLLDKPIRPVGTIIEFTDKYESIDNLSNKLDVEFDFNRFGDSSSDPVNSKLLEAYNKYKDELIVVSQQIESFIIDLDNNNRLKNSYIASLEAVNVALNIMPDDEQLLSIKNDLQLKIDEAIKNGQNLSDSINDLSTKKSTYEDSMRDLSKVIK